MRVQYVGILYVHTHVHIHTPDWEVDDLGMFLFRSLLQLNSGSSVVERGPS